MWALQESDPLLRFDVEALKNPVGHTLHVGSVVVEPGDDVYFPAGQLVCFVQNVLSALISVVMALKKPFLHAIHFASVVTVA